MIREQKTRVLQAPVDAVSFTQAQDLVMRWGHAHESRYVVLANVHVVVTATQEPDFGKVVAADRRAHV
jgi:N-acetylglucosaminyldiphosphoundecaprenol N-acetyl-beta-D-mannosaminyltransferase